VTSAVGGAAFDQGAPGRVVAIGTGGNNNAFTNDFGVTWTAGGAIGFVGQDIIWNETLGLFLVNSSSGSSVARSADATSWTLASHSLAVNGNGGIACLASGRTVVCGEEPSATFPRFSVSDNGSSWSDSGGFPADGGIAFLDRGYICGNGGSEIWHVGVRGNPGSGLRISVSGDGASWTTRADFTTIGHNIPPGAVQPTTQPRIMCCQNTGMLVVLACRVIDSSIFAIASMDRGFTWTDPVFFRGTNVRSFAVADGKLFRTVGARVEKSDGCGWRS
jgi:hypothetical protein